ncbi:MAG: RNA-guided endonuclease InsQ/TnpB family protein, partial [Sarcina sp.]
KKKGKCATSFYHLNNKFKVEENFITLEKIGKVKMKDENRLPKGNYKKENIKVYNPRIKYNGKYWYLSLALDKEDESYELSDVSVGIDLGISSLAVVSNIEKPFKNINKSKRVKQLNKRLKRMQRKVSKKYLMNKRGTKFTKSKNIIKLEKKIKLIHKKIADIRLNHIHQTTNAVVKTKPYRVVMEDLNVKGMLKNKHLSKAISEQSFNKFTTIMNDKCKKYGIEFIKADRFYPSSKMCSCCKKIKKDLKLKDRIYKCECGLVEDRDKNASINLANYQLVV